MHVLLSGFILPATLCLFTGVLIVDANGPGPFTDIQSACDVAAERDTILVKNGNYTSFDVDDSWLTIAADSGAIVHVQGGVRVHDLQPGKRVTLIGMIVDGITSTIPAQANALDVRNCEGAIRVVGCTLHGADGTPYPGTHRDGGDGVLVDSAPDVEVSRSQLRGGLGAYGYIGGIEAPGRGGAGAHAISSSVVLYDCDSHGGLGMYGTPDDGGVGGHGLHAEDSRLFASKTTFEGGDGGNHGFGGAIDYGGAGGDGVRLEGSGSLARLLDVTSIGGLGGLTQPLLGFEYPEPNGLPFNGTPAQFIQLPVGGRSMSIGTNPIREATSASITFTTVPGDRVALFVSSAASTAFNPNWNGEQMIPIGPFTRLVRIGTSSGSSMAHDMDFPELGAGVLAKTFMLQPLFLGANGQFVLGTPVPLLVLDSAY